jgi:hypothetical protein
MADLSITYYLGQIKPEYRGDRVLLMSLEEDNSLDILSDRINSEAALSWTRPGDIATRAYIGVNDSAQAALETRFKKGNLRSFFDLDLEVVDRKIVEQVAQQVADLQTSHLAAVIKTGK